MGKRGPQPGWKKAQAAKAAAPVAKKPAQAKQQTTVAAKTAAVVPLSAADRENPEKLTGAALRALAHRRGLSRTELAKMTDEKIRVQLRYLVHRQYDEAA